MPISGCHHVKATLGIAGRWPGRRKSEWSWIAIGYLERCAMVKDICCSSRGPRLGTQNTHAAPQTFTAPVTWNLMSFSVLWEARQAYSIDIYVGKIKRNEVFDTDNL